MFSFWPVLRGACGNSLPSLVQEFVVSTKHSLSSRSKIRMWIKSEKAIMSRFRNYYDWEYEQQGSKVALVRCMSQGMQRPWPKSKYEACHALSDVTTDNAPPVVDGIVRTGKLIRVLTICTNAGVLLLGRSCGLSSRRTRKHQRPKLKVHLFVSYMMR